MATGEAPITRTDLREELARALEHYATKADLAVLKAELVRGHGPTPRSGFRRTSPAW